MDLEHQLRTGLSTRAADIDTAPAGLLDDVLAGHRRYRHRRRAALVAGVAAVLVAVAIPVGVGVTGTAGGTRSAPATQAAFTPYPVGPRGDLAGDQAFVDGLLARDWWPATVGPQPAPDTRQVVFAARVPGGIQALVAGWLDGARVGQWLGGPAAATPAELTPTAEPVPVRDDLPQSFLLTADDTGSLVVVASPGDEIAVSPGEEITAAGEIVAAAYEPVGGPDGTAVVDAATLNQASYGVRVTRAGVPVEVAGSGSGTRGPGGDPDLGTALAGAAGDPDPDVVRLLVQGVLERTGLSGDDVAVGVRWGGPLSSGTLTAEAAVVTVRLPSGSTVLVAGATYAQEAGGDPWTSTVLCGQRILPADDVPADRLVAVRCDLIRLTDGASLGSQVVVVPPSGAVAVQLSGSGGAVIDTRELVGPAYAGPAPDGLQGAAALDAGGAVLVEGPLLGTADLQLD